MCSPSARSLHYQVLPGPSWHLITACHMFPLGFNSLPSPNFSAHQYIAHFPVRILSIRGMNSTRIACDFCWLLPRELASLAAFISEPGPRPEMAVRTNLDWDTELTAACRVSSVSTPTFRPLAFNAPIPVSTRLTTEGPNMLAASRNFKEAVNP
ncbi:uncharacterized protein LY79DRAFT_63296 [Colletotrichum navitas]|uniref:Uncharacterized protein n=1 Tax=Colletotrichum navitas TaxID=681940 RepID=A0AAD8Q635_9PEZI|nr:uncharacterized protein LY79DRAFT_63296 [Colletotrichum navitas]KAK1596395.1 hypothetical protein LY79DRAFT_63296 [Colletotrichum navitas]